MKLDDVNEISKACYDEFANMKALDSNDVDSIVNFDDVEACKKVDELCPVLSNALKDAMGGKHMQSDGESHTDHAIRTLCYGAILKARYINNYHYNVQAFHTVLQELERKA